MAQLVASIATQMRYDLLSKVGSSGMMEVTAQVNKFVSLLFKIENLLKNEDEDERVLKHLETIRYLYYRIQDALEASAVEVAAVIHNSDDGPCVRRILRTWLGSSLDVIALRNIKDLEPEIESFLQVFPDEDDINDEDDDEDNDSDSNQSEPSVVNHNTQNSPRRWPRQGYPGGCQEYFVGRKDDLFELKQHIIKKQKHDVISIWGEKGSGKTALVRKIYNDPEVRKQFKAFAWVSLKNEAQISIAMVLQEVLRQLGPSRKVAETTQDHIAQDLREIQGQKNCLIVFDRIELFDIWEKIRSDVCFNSQVLLTTRNEEIAQVERFSYRLRLLNEEEGWELLKTHAFPDIVSPATDIGMFPKLGKEMVGMCGYLPSTISSLGRKLINNPTLNDWQTVKSEITQWCKENKDITQYLQTDHYSEGDEGFFSDLGSKYDGLSYDLRQCFLYLGGIFRQNESIDAQDLTFLWMAEGMVSCLDQSREDAMIRTAQNYLRELAERGMLEVQLDEFSGNRMFNLCYLHHRVRELSLYQGEKEDFPLKVVDFCDGSLSALDSPATFDDKTRRLVIHFSKPVKLSSKNLDAMIHMRSLLFLNHGKGYTDLPSTFNFEKFKLLRVVHFVRCKFQGRVLPKGIDKLINLRYLGLLYCDLMELPHSISNLRNLNVLNLRVYDTAHLIIPNVLFQMKRLKHLCLPHYSESEQDKKLSLDDLRELETLVGFNSLIHDLSSLTGLENLRRLEAHAYSNDSVVSIIYFISVYGARTRTNLCIENKCDFTSPEGLAILEETLMCVNLYELTLSMVPIYKFPDCGKFVSSELTQLKLIGCKIKADPMEAIGKFPNLHKLCLGYGAFIGRKMIIRKGGFQSLDDLELQSLPNLEEWEVQEEALPNLSGLVIRRCPKFERIPSSLRHVTTLKSMDIELTPNGLAGDQEDKYLQDFKFVNSFRIRVVDPLSG